MYLVQLFQIAFDFHRVKIILHVGANNIRDSQELVSGSSNFFPQHLECLSHHFTELKSNTLYFTSSHHKALTFR